jgi:hypothetical protein
MKLACSAAESGAAAIEFGSFAALNFWDNYRKRIEDNLECASLNRSN